MPTWPSVAGPPWQQLPGARAARAGIRDHQPADRWLAESALAARASGSIDRGSRQAIAALPDALSKAHRLPASLARHPEPDRDVQAVTWLYRVLFLLYAEARGVVPTWHPIYRDAYALAPVCEQITRGTTPRGLAPMLSAVMRLARLGCDVDALRVTAFNGRLFDPRQAPQLERLELDDRVLADVLRGLTSQPRFVAGAACGCVRAMVSSNSGRSPRTPARRQATQLSRAARVDRGTRRPGRLTPRPLTEISSGARSPLVETATRPDPRLCARSGHGRRRDAGGGVSPRPCVRRALVEHGVAALPA
jgi:hypothetical protein